jgi:hypothetical protein
MVVYFMTEQSRFGSGSQQSIIAQGEPVREGQKLMSIPDLSNMVVNTRVNEALVARVRGEEYQRTGFGDALRAAMMYSAVDPFLSAGRVLGRYALPEVKDEELEKLEQRQTYPGQRAMVRVDAFPSKVLKGHVKNVATVNSQQDYFSSDVKVYQTLVAIDEPLKGVKPGMSAEVTIFSDKQLDDVLAIPVQAVLGSPDMGPKRKCYVLPPGASEPEEREIVVGMSNDKMAEVQQGLKAGELVVMNARQLYPDKNKAKMSAGDKLDPGPAPKRGPGGEKPAGASPGAAPGGAPKNFTP